MANAGDIDFHFFVKYQWPADVNDEANSAFCQQRIDLIAPYVTSTQVTCWLRPLLYWLYLLVVSTGCSYIIVAVLCAEHNCDTHIWPELQSTADMTNFQWPFAVMFPELCLTTATAPDSCALLWQYWTVLRRCWLLHSNCVTARTAP